MPNRYIVYGVRGVGKTSLFTYAPKPIFVQVAGETGLETLIDSGQVPETTHLPPINDWVSFLSILDQLLNDPHDYRTLVVDTFDTLQELCHAEVSRRDYDSDRTSKKWLNYQAGPISSVAEWRMMHAKIDRLREQRSMTFVGLAHSNVKDFKNPIGSDYSKFDGTLDYRLWNVTADWADALLFYTFEIYNTETDLKKKGKALGGQTRVLYCQNHAAYEAKNRIGLPSEIVLADSAEESWKILYEAIKAGRSNASGKVSE